MTQLGIRFTGDELDLEPPFYFEGMTSSTFPIRASIAKMQRFCDSYLNIIPEELGHFRVSVPYAYLQLLDYGKMAVHVANLGWFSQREVLFNIPIEWHRRVNGRLEFHAWATLAPFIYVDQPLSMVTGRRVYGWPKTLATFDGAETGWIEDPGSATIDASVRARVFAEAYAGAQTEDRTFLKLRSSGSAYSQFPPQMNGPLMPWTTMTNVARALSGYTRDALEIFRAFGLLPFPSAQAPANVMQMVLRELELAAQPGGIRFNTLNFKQFRRADKEEDYCYQALTNGPMRFTGFNRIALLGESALATGDASGGFAVELTRYPSLPIVDLLGLETAGEREVDGDRVLTLKPVLPFYMSCNMEYERGENIAWRTSDGQWFDGAGRAVRSSSGSESRRFNNTLGFGTRVVSGPFDFVGVESHVMPLLARTEVLQGFVDRGLNAPLEGTGEHFEIWSGGNFAYVYMFVDDLGTVTSDTNDIGDWADRAVTFYIPVRHYHGSGAGRYLRSVGLFPAYAFADSPTQAHTQSELLGIETVSADLDIPPGPWSGSSQGDESQALFSVRASILPALGQGEKMRQRFVIKIRTGEPYLAAHEPVPLSNVADGFYRKLKKELERKKHIKSEDKALGRRVLLDFLANGRQMNTYVLKQFRDCQSPRNACYQALVRIPTVFTNIHHLQEMENPLELQLHDYASLSIAKQLGLVSRDIRTGGGGTVSVVEPVRPFAVSYDMRVGTTTGSGERLMSRDGLRDWVWAGGTMRMAHTQCEISRNLEREVSECRPTRLQKTVKDWLEHETRTLTRLSEEADDEIYRSWLTYAEQEGRLSQSELLELARDADSRELKDWFRYHRSEGTWGATGPQLVTLAERIDPQCVLETVLSLEWENRSETARCRRAREDLAASITEETTAWGGGVRRLKKTVSLLRPELPNRADEVAELAARIEDLSQLEELFARLLPAEQDADASPEAAGRVLDAYRSAATQELIRNVLGWLDPGADVSTPFLPYHVPLSHRPTEEQMAELVRDVARCSEAVVDTEHAGQELLTLRREVASVVRRVLQYAYPEAEQCVGRAMDAAAHRHRKPPHCIRRMNAAQDADRLFPRKDSWETDWYCGEQLSAYRAGKVRASRSTERVEAASVPSAES